MKLTVLVDNNTLTSKNLKSILDIILESTDSIEIIMKNEGIETQTVCSLFCIA